MWRGVMLMGFLKRLPELVSDRQGQLSTTDATTIIALMVSSAALMVIVFRWERVAAEALGMFLGAWVTHAGIQRYHDSKTGDVPPGQQGGKSDERGAD